MRLEEIANASAEVAGSSSRLAKIATLAGALQRLRPEEVPVAVAYLSGELPQGSVGIGWASLRELPPAAKPPGTLELMELDAAVSRIAAAPGQGPQARRRSGLPSLFARATRSAAPSRRSS